MTSARDLQNPIEMDATSSLITQIRKDFLKNTRSLRIERATNGWWSSIERDRNQNSTMKIEGVPSMLKGSVDENTTKYEVQRDVSLSQWGADWSHLLYDSGSICFRTAA